MRNGIHAEVNQNTLLLQFYISMTQLQRRNTAENIKYRKRFKANVCTSSYIELHRTQIIKYNININNKQSQYASGAEFATLRLSSCNQSQLDRHWPLSNETLVVCFLKENSKEMLGLTLRNFMIFYYEWKKSKSNLARLCEYMFMMRRLKNQAIQDLHFGTHFGREPEKTSGNCQYKTSNSILIQMTTSRRKY